jgi:hypothetical protein
VRFLWEEGSKENNRRKDEQQEEKPDTKDEGVLEHSLGGYFT